MTFGQWYHIQAVVQSHASGGAFYRLYVNNNNEGSPNEEVSGFTRTTNNWNDSISVGGFWTHVNSNRISRWIVDDIEFGTGHSTIRSARPRPSAPAQRRHYAHLCVSVVESRLAYGRCFGVS